MSPLRRRMIDDMGVTTRPVRSCTTFENIAERHGFLGQAAAMSFSLPKRSGRKMPSGWGSRIQSQIPVRSMCSPMPAFSTDSQDEANPDMPAGSIQQVDQAGVGLSDTR
jgi:hypothetical protein